MTAEETPLSKSMRLTANACNLPADHELRTLADAFDAAAAGFYAAEQTVTPKQFMGHWARARGAWCRYTGTPLL